VIISFVLVYHTNYETKIGLVDRLKQKLLQNIGLFIRKLLKVAYSFS